MKKPDGIEVPTPEDIAAVELSTRQRLINTYISRISKQMFQNAQKKFYFPREDWDVLEEVSQKFQEKGWKVAIRPALTFVGRPMIVILFAKDTRESLKMKEEEDFKEWLNTSPGGKAMEAVRYMSDMAKANILKKLFGKRSK